MAEESIAEDNSRASVHQPKYNFEAIKNYPPFRDVYNAQQRRSKSLVNGQRGGQVAAAGGGTSSRTRSSSECSSSIKCRL